MMLNSIFLHLDGRYFPGDMRLRLKDQSRHITYCIQRALKDIKFHTEGFNRIVIEPLINPTHTVFVNSSSVASLSVGFDPERFNQCSDAELRFYHAELIKEGLRAFNAKVAIPIDHMFEAIDQLMENDFVDEWVFKEKFFKKMKISATLTCSMSYREFNLNLMVRKNGEVFFNENVLTTPPDEICFHYEFKDLTANGGFIEVGRRYPRDGVLVKEPI